MANTGFTTANQLTGQSRLPALSLSGLVIEWMSNHVFTCSVSRYVYCNVHVSPFKLTELYRQTVKSPG